MIDHSAVRSTLRERLLQVEGVSESLVAWENRSFTPLGDLWIRETFMPGSERQTATEMLTLVGVVQYDVFCTLGNGLEEAEKLACRIGSAFEPNQTLLGATSVIIIRAEKLQGRRGDDAMERRTSEPYNQYAIPVQVTWRVHSLMTKES